jgi:short-subunit dehydrogenase
MIVVITGASKGLGKAFAISFATKASVFILSARTKEDLLEVKQAINNINPSCQVHIYAANLSNKQAVLQLGNFCNEIGAVDILINNVGYFLPGSTYNEEDGTLEKMIETNLYSAYYLTHSVLPKMMQAQKGHIFNICSIASVQAYANGGSYSISKFALYGYSKNLREELKQHNIKVTAVLPGAVYTNSWAGSGIDENRIMQANDIAKMVFVASELSFQACVEDIVIRPQLGDL